MIPQTVIKPEIFSGLEIITQPSKTFGINFETGRVTGIIDGDEALRQAVYCILNTERFDYLIHSHNHGIERKDLYGENKRFLMTKLQGRITDALLQDDRISDVSGFKFSYEGRKYGVYFEVTSNTGQKVDFIYEAVI